MKKSLINSMKKPMSQKTKTVNIRIEHYHFIHARVGDYRVTVNDKGQLGAEGNRLSANHLACILRHDFRNEFPLIPKKEINMIMFAVLGDLMTKSKKELEKT